MYFKLLQNINIFNLSCIFGKMIHFPTSIEPTTKRSSAYYHGSNESPSVELTFVRCAVGVWRADI